MLKMAGIVFFEAKTKLYRKAYQAQKRRNQMETKDFANAKYISAAQKTIEKLYQKKILIQKHF